MVDVVAFAFAVPAVSVVVTSDEVASSEFVISVVFVVNVDVTIVFVVVPATVVSDVVVGTVSASGRFVGSVLTSTVGTALTVVCTTGSVLASTVVKDTRVLVRSYGMVVVSLEDGSLVSFESPLVPTTRSRPASL